MIDYWHDRQPMCRASIQLHMLSGNSKMRDRISYCVSTNGMEFIVLIPKSTYMTNPAKALEHVALDGIEKGHKEHKKILSYHPKTAACHCHVHSYEHTNTMEF